MSQLIRQQRKRRNVQRWLLILLMAVASGLVMASAQTAGQPDYAAPVRDASQKAIEQLTLAIRVALIAPVTPAMADMKLNAARILNILVGEGSEFYQRNVQNIPGADGFGVIPRLQQIRTALAPAAQNNNAQAQSMLNALEGIEFLAALARDDLNTALKNQDERQVRFILRRLFALLAAARGSKEDPLSEGGARALYAQVNRQP